MEQWKKWKVPAAVLAALCLFSVFMYSLSYAFVQYRNEIIKEQEEQLLNIAKAVSNSISIYTEFYFEDLQKTVGLREYQKAERAYRAIGDSSSLMQFFSEQGEYQNRELKAIFLSPEGEKPCFYGDGTLLYGRAESYESVYSLKGKVPGSQIDVMRDGNNVFYLGLSILTSENNSRLFYVINIQEMYGEVCSYIKVGENGYVMIKDSTGRILMHPVEEQIGIDVIADRAKMYPNFDLSELEAMISHQLQGTEDVEIYHSYWWADETPRRVKKICAYTPVWFGDDFLIVAAVIDYSEIGIPIMKATVSVFLIASILASALAVAARRFSQMARERKRTEQENRRLRELNAKLEELRAKEEKIAHDQRLQLIGTMTGGIAHEFNNLLTPIMGYSGMILMEADPESEVYENAGEIYHSAERAKELIRQIASLSRKQTVSAPTPMEIKKAMEGAIKILETVKPSNVRLAVREDWPEGRYLLCGETEWNQVILNICTNAFHAMKDRDGVLKLDGEILSGERAEPFCHPGMHYEDYFCLSIQDNGVGIPEYQRERIFDPFFTTKPVGEGTGLGLSVVRSILDYLNGGIAVESQEGTGTRVILYFPLARETKPIPQEKKAEHKKAKKQGKHVLLVEDDKKIRKLFERGLRMAGYEVITAAEPETARKLLEQRRFDVIITDYAMPGMNGVQFASMAEEMGIDCKIILITGMAEEQALAAYENKQIQELLMKPISCQLLVEAVERCLEEES